VKAERLGTFHFMPGHCGCICEDEIELLSALQAARRPGAAPDDKTLLVLARHSAAERLPAALRSLADLLDAMATTRLRDDGAEEPNHTPSRPPLH
jgi:hypothetical protein